jgi:hypothetical protein
MKRTAADNLQALNVQNLWFVTLRGKPKLKISSTSGLQLPRIWEHKTQTLKTLKSWLQKEWAGSLKLKMAPDTTQLMWNFEGIQRVETWKAKLTHLTLVAANWGLGGALHYTKEKTEFPESWGS